MQSVPARVLSRLGFQDGLAVDEAGLRALYRAWCLSVPFDNIRKLIAHASGGQDALPGTDAQDFLENWLEHGTGGTCWPSSNALHAVAEAAGFCASRASAAMWDAGAPTHGTVIVSVDGRDWAIDSSILTINPIPLVENAIHIQPGPLHPVEAEWFEGTFVFWFEAPNFSSMFPCRLLNRHVEHEFYAGRYEWSRTNGPFNARLFVRRNFPGRLVMLIGNTKWERTAEGQTESQLTADELVAELTGRHGYSREIVDRWIGAGGLDAAMAPPASRPDPPALTRVAPSMRG